MVLTGGRDPVTLSYIGSSLALCSVLSNCATVAVIFALLLLTIMVITVVETTTQMISAATRTPIDTVYTESVFESCITTVSVDLGRRVLVDVVFRFVAW
jgi:hypothetical protein